MSPPTYLFQLAGLFDFVEEVVVWIKDRDGRYRWVNRAFLINYAVNNRFDPASIELGVVLGKSDYDLSPGYLADQFLHDDEYVLSGKRIVDRIEQVGQPDGSTVWNVTNKIPLLDVDGSVVGTAGMTRRLEASQQRGTPGVAFGPVLAYMRDHYHTTISNKHLARLAHLSVRAFERKFHGCFHITPQKYIRRLQLRMASRALVYTSQPLADVAVECGFSDQSHFTREFRRYFGRTPREFRAHYARQGADAAPVPNPAAEEQ